MELINFRLKGQSAIEYLMTYGWMLLVVAIVGGAVLSVIGERGIETSSGFTGSDFTVVNFGVSQEGKLDMVLRNTGSDPVEIDKLTLMQDGQEFTTGVGRQVEVGDSATVKALGAVESSDLNTVDVKAYYDTGNLENLTLEGKISGDLEVPISGETQTSNWAFVDVSEASQDVVDTSGMEDFYVMQYEASSASNVSEPGDSASPVSVEGHVPWTQINRHDAYQVCRDAGYDLPSNEQWQASTMAEIGDSASQPLGNNDEGQSIDDGSSGALSGYKNTTLTGSGPESWSNELGVYDLNGNVWEWTNTTFDDTSSPYYDVSGKDSNGHNYVDSWNPSIGAPGSLSSDVGYDFGKDVYYGESSLGDTRAVRRGGAWSSSTTAGVFSIYVASGPSSGADNVGFRCSIS